jgi:hypothetical protein
MIRRDIRLADGRAGWLLISQIEHARVSAELAARCAGRFARCEPRAAPERPEPAPATVRDELLAAIAHHDDGWTQWERSPRLDPGSGRPLAFTELEPAEAVDIWSRSVAAAEAIGPLAAWLVASHFARLGRRAAGDRARATAAPELRTWIAEIDLRCGTWLAAWQRQDAPRHTETLAAEALQWLWTFDEVSLWLCCTCLAHEPIPCAPEPHCAGRGTPIEMELLAPAPGAATATPWRFDGDGLEATISGIAVPAGHYENAANMLARGVPQSLNWRLSSAKKPLETPSGPRS